MGEVMERWEREWRDGRGDGGMGEVMEGWEREWRDGRKKGMKGNLFARTEEVADKDERYRDAHPHAHQSHHGAKGDLRGGDGGVVNEPVVKW